MSLLVWVVNSFKAKVMLARGTSVLFVFHIGLFIGVLIFLTVCAPKQSAADIFTVFTQQCALCGSGLVTHVVSDRKHFHGPVLLVRRSD